MICLMEDRNRDGEQPPKSWGTRAMDQKQGPVGEDLGERK